MSATEWWMFKNEHRTLFLGLTDEGSRGYVIDPRRAPYVWIATPEDMVTNQYTEAKFVRRGGTP
jgi:hypothetical protein